MSGHVPALSALIFGASLAFGAMADAASYTVVKNYGTNYGVDGTASAGGGSRVSYGSDYAQLTDSTSAPYIPFFQSFDLSSYSGKITDISFTLTYSGARDQSFAGFIGERWSVYAADRLNGAGVPDSSSSNTAHQFSTTLAAQGPSTYVLTGNALSTAIAGQLATIWFGENTLSQGSFRLNSIAMNVTAVPVPAAGLLLLGSLGGLALLRRRKAAQAL